MSTTVTTLTDPRTSTPPTAPIASTKLAPDTIPAAPNNTSLLDLPYEIRSNIYKHLYRNSKICTGREQSTWPFCTHTVCACLFPRHLSSTCRQLRHETMSLLTSNTVLEIAGSFARINAMPAVYKDGIEKAIVLNPKAFAAQLHHVPCLSGLKVLELRNIDVWCKFYDEVFLESEAANECMINMAFFNLKRIDPNFVLFCAGPREFRILLFCQFVVNSLYDATIHAVIDLDAQKVVHKSRGPPMKNMNSWSTAP